MRSTIKGIPVVLYERVQNGEDAMKNPVYEEVPVTVENVLIAPAADSDIVSDLQLWGKRAEYELSIPKGDTHNWEDSRVDFFGKSWRTFGFPKEYINEMVPLDWNRKVRVERYG